MRDVGEVWYVWRNIHSPKLPYILQFLLRYGEDSKECQMLDRFNLSFSLKLNLNPISILFCNNKEDRIIVLFAIFWLLVTILQAISMKTAINICLTYVKTHLIFNEYGLPWGVQMQTKHLKNIS